MSLSVDRIDWVFFFFWCCVCCCVEYLVEECLSTKDEKVGRVSMCHTALTAGISYAAPQLVTRTLAVSFVRRRRVIGPSLKHNDTRCDVCVFPIFSFSSFPISHAPLPRLPRTAGFTNIGASTDFGHSHSPVPVFSNLYIVK